MVISDFDLRVDKLVMSDPSAQLEAMKQQVLRMNPAQRKAFIKKLKENPALAQQANQFLGPAVLKFLYQDENSNLVNSPSNSLVTNFRTNIQPIRRGRGRGRPPRSFQSTRGVEEARRNLYRIQVNQLLKIPYPKPVVNEVNFIPRFDKDFCCLIGLDLVVQQIKEDENVFRRYEGNPYVCEECGTDYTPSWKTADEDGNLHIFCENCFMKSQKKNVISHQTAIFKRAFANNANEELELAKEIADGKFNKNDHRPVLVSQGSRASSSLVPIAPKQTTSGNPVTSGASSSKRWTLTFRF
ncbi:hypothetical protein FO519_004007 [Halicephalobus sp. NKZ332]|nr:hypothetical protein FO519_004007 [Halicephalobus sp. NKZ332]